MELVRIAAVLPDEFGRVGWSTNEFMCRLMDARIHRAMNDEKEKEKLTQQFLRMLTRLALVLPCSTCSGHFEEQLQTRAAGSNMKSQTWTEWVRSAQKWVVATNRKKTKNPFSFEVKQVAKVTLGPESLSQTCESEPIQVVYFNTILFLTIIIHCFYFPLTSKKLQDWWLTTIQEIFTVGLEFSLRASSMRMLENFVCAQTHTEVFANWVAFLHTFNTVPKWALAVETASFVAATCIHYHVLDPFKIKHEIV